MKKKDNILRLKYRLEPKEDDMVEFQIIHQHHSITNRISGGYMILYGDYLDWTVSSEDCPSVMSGLKIVCLRGCKYHKDKLVVKFKGHRLIPSIHKALEEMVKKVFGNCTVVKG